jgi:bifunctional DNA-binding transcriptional regulator/antitoxin component of YhaV-PrlF toxin-antitoxin module
MMSRTTIRLTSKRQATFPSDLCDSLNLVPGDRLELVPRIEDGEKVWMLKVQKRPDRAWLGGLKKYGEAVTDHSMDAIHHSVREGRAEEAGQ